MLRYPQWSDAFHVQAVGDNNVIVMNERDYFVLTGRAFAVLARVLDGDHDLSSVLRSFPGGISTPELMLALSQLERQGFVREAEPMFPVALRAFWQSHAQGAEVAEAAVARMAVRLVAFGDVDPGPVREALATGGFRFDDEGGVPVILTDDYLRPEIAAINLRQLDRGEPWMLAKPAGAKLWIGPLFRGRAGGCWTCLAQRLRSNRQVERFIETVGGKTPRLSRPAYAAHASVAANVVAAELARFAAGAADALDGAVVSIDTADWSTERHTLVKRPQCPSCGDPDYARRTPQPLAITAPEIRFRADGGHRVVPPDVTYRRLRRHVSPITGVVTNLTSMNEDDDSGLSYSYSAGHNFAMMNNTLSWLLQNMRGRSGGKGVTDIQARVSAICEAIERYSGLHNGEEISTRATLRELGSRAIHPNALMNFSDRQLDDREAYNAGEQSAYHRAPVRLDADRTIDWTPAWSFKRQDFVQIPSAYCYYGHPDLQSQYFCTCDANGSAAGNTIEEAIVQGFLELVERDSVAIWWYNRVSRPAVDIRSFDNPYLNDLVDHYRKDGRDIWALDLTTDLGVPCYAAISRRTDRATEDLVLGFGAHFDPGLALLRAMTEVNQFMPAVSRVDQHGQTVYWFHDPDAVAWWRTATLASQPYLSPDPHRPAIVASSVPRRHDADLGATVARCAAIADAIGSDLIVLDQTQPDIGLPVVKVMVPGMRHFWKRFGAGRLYDVPVRLGWLDAPRSEADLNPIGIFF